MNYIEINNFSDKKVLDIAHKKLSNLYLTDCSKGVFVNEDGIKIFTLNGLSLLTFIPEVLTLYNHSYTLIKEKYYNNLTHLTEVDVAISANILSSNNSDKFRMHFDRNQITCIIYLSNNPHMPLKLYPDVRLDPLIYGKVEFELSNFQSVYIQPNINKALIFNGNRSFHGIEYTNNKKTVINDLRFSIQFGFNIAEKLNLPKDKYYGRG